MLSNFSALVLSNSILLAWISVSTSATFVFVASKFSVVTVSGSSSISLFTLISAQLTTQLVLVISSPLSSLYVPTAPVSVTTISSTSP